MEVDPPIVLGVPISVILPVAALKVPLLVQFPETVSVLVVEVVRIPLLVRLLHTAAVLMVTVIPLLMVTSSVEVGTAAPPHVPVELQLPLAEAVLAADLATSTVNRRKMNKKIVLIPNILKFEFSD